MLDEKIAKLIEKLPKDLQPFAPHYIELLKRFTAAEIANLVSQTVSGDSQIAYKSLVSKMSDDELLEEMTRLNTVMDGLITGARAEAEYLKNFITVAITIGLAAI